MMRAIRYMMAALLTAACLTAAAQQAPERSQVRKGNRQYNKGRYERSMEYYERALATAPENFEATYDLGNALYKAERFDRSEQTLRRAAADTLRTAEERAEAFYNLGNAQFRQQKYKEALESYKQSLRLNPSDMEAKYNYAYTKRLLEQNQDDQQQNGGDQNQQNQDNQNNQNNNDQQDQQGQNDPQQGDNDDRNGDNGDDPDDPDDNGDERDGEGQPQPSGISPQEQQQMLDAIQAQEDKTQDKLKEKARGVVIRGRKNW